jgi:autotransporter-associated beta strand protein
VQSKSTFDTNSFTTVFAGNLTDVQRSLTITNTGASSGNVTFGAFQFGSALELTVSKGNGTSTSVTFENGIQQTASSDQLLLKGNSGTLGGVEQVLVGAAATPTLTNGIVAPWIVVDSGASNNPYDFATYGNATGYTAFSGYTGNLAAATPTSVIKQAAAVTLNGNTTAYALNVQKGVAVNTGGNTLTIGDGSNAGLILNGGSGSGIMSGNLSFGAAKAYVTINGSSTISSTIIGSGGLNLAGTGTLTLSSPSQETGLVTVNSGTLVLTGANVFAGDVNGLLLQNTKNLALAQLTISANNQFATLNSGGNNSTITINGASVLTIGDSNNLASTISSTINDSTTNVAGAITKDGTGLLDLSGATVTLGAGSSMIANAGALRVATGALKNTAVAGTAPNFLLNNGADLQFAQSGGGQYAGNISGNGTLHLIGGTLQLTGVNNSYTGGTIVEFGSTLDTTTANLPTVNENITDAGGLVVFDQATTGNFTGVISDGKEMGTGPLMQGSLDKDDSTGNNTGNVVLTQAQTFTGQTTVEAGTLTLAAVDTLATSSGVDLGRIGGNSTATLALAANNTIQALTSEKNDQTFVTLGSSTLTINTPSGTVANFGGDITGAGGVVKAGAGEQIFSGADTFSGGATVQAGALVVTGSINSAGNATVTGGILDLANHGALTTTTTTVNGGLLELDTGSTLTAATVNVGPQGTVFANGGLANVTTYDNSGALNLRAGAPGNTFTLNNYVGVAGSQLQIGVNFATGAADKLLVTTATGTTAIVVADTAPLTPAAYNPAGIPVVISTGAMSSTAFTLAGGPVQKGLFQYDLAYNPDPRFLLVSVPTADAYRLDTLPTAAQSIWLDTAGVWLDRQTDLRDELIEGASLAGPAAQGAAPSPAAPALTTGVWARAVGDWTDRSETQRYSLLNKTYTYNTGYNQSTGAFFAGVDGGKQGVLGGDDAVLFGMTAGYIDSTQDFKNASTSANYTGGSIGGSVTYVNRNLFADVLVKGDFLNLNYSDPALAPFGVSRSGGGVTNLGVIADVGYRFGFGPGFVEPLGTLADVSSRVQAFSLAGAHVSFADNDSFRGRVGLRAGATLADNAEVRVEGSATVSYWGRISGGSSAVINSGAGAPLLGISDPQVTSYAQAGAALNLFSKTSGWSGFVKGDYAFASGFDDGSVKGGVRLDF